MEDSNEGQEYILLTKEEYTEAKNFPSQIICRPPIPDQIQKEKTIKSFPKFASFMQMKSGERKGGMGDQHGISENSNNQMEKRIQDLEQYINDLLEENNQLKFNFSKQSITQNGRVPPQKEKQNLQKINVQLSKENKQIKSQQQAFVSKMKTQRKDFMIKYEDIKSQNDKLQNMNKQLSRKLQTSLDQRQKRQKTGSSEIKQMEREQKKVLILENELQRMQQDQQRLVEEIEIVNDQLKKTHLEFEKETKESNEIITRLELELAPFKQNNSLLQEENQIMGQKIKSLNKIKENLEMQIQQLRQDKSLQLTQDIGQISQLEEKIVQETQGKQKWKKLLIQKEQEMTDFTERQLKDMADLEVKMREQQSEIQNLASKNMSTNLENQSQTEQINLQKEKIDEQEDKIHHLQQYKDTYNELKDQTSDQLSKIVKKLSGLEEENFELKRQIQVDNQNLNSTEKAHEEANQRIQQLNRSLIEIEEENQEKALIIDEERFQQQQRFIGEINQLHQKEKKKMEEQMDEILTGEKRLMQENSEMQRECGRLEEVIEQKSNQCKFLEQKLNISLKELRITLDLKLAQSLDEQASQFKSKEERLSEQIRQYQRTINSVKDQIPSFLKQISSLKTTIQEKTEQIEGLSHSNSIRKSKILQTDSKIRKIEDKLKDQDKIDGELDFLSKKKEELEIKFVLMAFENERLANFHNELIDMSDNWKRKFLDAEKASRKEKSAYTRNIQDLSAQKKVSFLLEFLNVLSYFLPGQQRHLRQLIIIIQRGKLYYQRISSTNFSKIQTMNVQRQRNSIKKTISSNRKK